MTAETVQSGRTRDKTVYTLTSAGRETFERLMRHFSQSDVRIFLDFNAVIVSLSLLENAEAGECCQNIRASLQKTKDQITEQLSAGKAMTPLGRAVPVQQLMLLNALEAWETDFEKQPAENRRDGTMLTAVILTLIIYLPFHLFGIYLPFHLFGEAVGTCRRGCRNIRGFPITLPTDAGWRTICSYTIRCSCSPSVRQWPGICLLWDRCADLASDQLWRSRVLDIHGPQSGAGTDLRHSISDGPGRRPALFCRGRHPVWPDSRLVVIIGAPTTFSMPAYRFFASGLH